MKYSKYHNNAWKRLEGPWRFIQKMKARDLELEQAVARERARCLWCLDELMKEVRKSLDNKILEESKIHLIKVKVAIAQGVCDRARRMIVSGAKPKESSNGR
jgi:hypothetical protein